MVTAHHFHHYKPMTTPFFDFLFDGDGDGDEREVDVEGNRGYEKTKEKRMKKKIYI